MKFTLQSTGEDIGFAPARVIIAGYTGRDQEKVRAHIRELEAEGIPPPGEIPTIFHATLDRLTSAGDFPVAGPRTCGEAEVVLLVGGGNVWIAVGSDHTDRELEKGDIPASKQACPKPVSARVWSYADVRPRWDDLVLRSWTGEAGREQLYQEGRMGALMKPEDILALLGRRGEQAENAAVYTGTIPLIAGAFAFKPYFESELFDPATGRSLNCAYRARPAAV